MCHSTFKVIVYLLGIELSPVKNQAQHANAKLTSLPCCSETNFFAQPLSYRISDINIINFMKQNLLPREKTKLKTHEGEVTDQKFQSDNTFCGYPSLGSPAPGRQLIQL